MIYNVSLTNMYGEIAVLSFIHKYFMQGKLGTTPDKIIKKLTLAFI